MTDYVVLEARDRSGGRIHGVAATPEAVAQDAKIFDLGAAWFWPDWQPELAQLVAGLDLETVLQDESADMLVERSLHVQPVRMSGLMAEPPSFRLQGGMTALVTALQRQIDPDRFLARMPVRQLHLTDGSLRIVSETGVTCRAEHVLLALPPGLAAGLAFDPLLPPALLRQWQQTETWMAPHAKYLAVYREPFWQTAGLSGFASSRIGPLNEIHDLSSPDGPAALFGFFAAPASFRSRMTDDALREQCRIQLVRLFGPQAATPVFDVIKDWSQDGFTAAAADHQSSGQHPHPPAIGPDSGVWKNRIVGIASEWSTTFPGYLAGAVDAARRGVGLLLAGQD